MKVHDDKKPFEKDWEEHLYDVDQLTTYPRWGVCGKNGLVIIDSDNKIMEAFVRATIPATFETQSPRHKTAHFYLKIVGGNVPNRTLVDAKTGKDAGEIRADDQQVLAPGTEIIYKDLETGEEKKGRYIITQDIPIATMQYEDFMAKFKITRKVLTHDEIENGVTRGTRHDRGIRYASKLISELLLDDEQALASMKVWNQHNDPPMPDEDLIRQIKNAREYKNNKDNAIAEDITALKEAKLIPQNTPTVVSKPEPTAMQLAGYTVGFNKKGGGMSLSKNGRVIDDIPGKESDRKNLAREHKIEYSELKQAILDAKNPSPSIEAAMGDNRLEVKTVEMPGGVDYEQILGGKYARYNKATDEVQLVDAIDMGDVIHVPLKKEIWPLASEAVKPESFNELFANVVTFIYNHVDYGEEDTPYTVHAAYILATYLLELWPFVPYRRMDGLINTGKTRSMEVTKALAFRVLMSSNISEAAIFRTCDLYHPTLCLDETGRYTKDKTNTTLDLLNAGQRRGVPAIRMVKTGDSMELGIFDVFGFKELAGTEELTAATNSRSIVYQMKKRTRVLNPLIDEKSARELRNRILYWRFQVLAKYHGGNGGNGGIEEILGCMNALVELGFDSRQVELYTPLLLIAPEAANNDIISFMTLEEEQKQLEEKESLESQIVETLNQAHTNAAQRSDEEKKAGDTLSTQYITTNEVWEAVNYTRNESEAVSKSRIGRMLKTFGFTKTKNLDGLASIQPNFPLMKGLYERYCGGVSIKKSYEGLTIPKISSNPPNPPNPPVENTDTNDTKTSNNVLLVSEEVAPEASNTSVTTLKGTERTPLDEDDKRFEEIFFECHGAASSDYLASKLKLTDEAVLFRLKMLKQRGWVDFDLLSGIWRWIT